MLFSCWPRQFSLISLWMWIIGLWVQERIEFITQPQRELTRTDWTKKQTAAERAEGEARFTRKVHFDWLHQRSRSCDGGETAFSAATADPDGSQDLGVGVPPLEDADANSIEAEWEFQSSRFWRPSIADRAHGEMLLYIMLHEQFHGLGCCS